MSVKLLELGKESKMTFLIESLIACVIFTLFVFHIKGALIGMLLGIPAALVAGLIVII